MLSYLRKYHRNIYSIIISFLLAVWFNGVSGLVTIWFPHKNVIISLMLMIIPILILMTDDGTLNAMYLYENNANAATSAALHQHYTANDDRP